jgi:hypothetical protein
MAVPQNQINPRNKVWRIIEIISGFVLLASSATNHSAPLGAKYGSPG